MSKNTVFVIGAGASYEANLPTGDELKKIISKLLDDPKGLNGLNTSICEAIFAHTNGDTHEAGNRYIPVAKHISKGLLLSISIDNFIDEHRDNKDEIPLCSKLAIVKSILEAERKSILYIGRSNSSTLGIDFSKLDKTWYMPFFRLLTEKCEKSDLEERFRSITLIIFNYDRCIEHFIFYALQAKYLDMTSTEAGILVKNIQIFHPYGDVGTLPFYGENDGVSFGGEVFSRQLLELSRKIKTFTEGVESKETEKIRYSEGVNNFV